MNLNFEQTIEDVHIYSVESVEALSPDDLVDKDRVTAVGVYYMVSEYPRFRTALSDDLRIDEGSAVAQLSDIVGWVGEQSYVDLIAFLFVHELSEDDFREWERVHMALPFMKSQGCDFMADASGEFDVG